MKRYLVLILISLILILTGVLAGIWFPPYSKDNSLNLSSLQKPETSLKEMHVSTTDVENLSLEEWQVDPAILLQATPPKTGEQPQFALTTAAIEYELAKHNNEDLPPHLICAEENDAPAAAHSTWSPLKVHHLRGRMSNWERLTEWINPLSFDSQYQVILWNPAGETDRYTLATDEPQHPVKESTVTSVTCEERT